MKGSKEYESLSDKPPEVDGTGGQAACDNCGHEHAGVEYAFICVGCPCPQQPGKPQRDAKELAKGVPWSDLWRDAQASSRIAPEHAQWHARAGVPFPCHACVVPTPIEYNAAVAGALSAAASEARQCVEEEYRLFRADARRELEEARISATCDTGETWETECARARAERDAAQARVASLERLVGDQTRGTLSAGALKAVQDRTLRRVFDEVGIAIATVEESFARSSPKRDGAREALRVVARIRDQHLHESRCAACRGNVLPCVACRERIERGAAT